MKSYWNFNIKEYLSDYLTYEKALRNKKEALHELTDVQALSYDKEAVQTSSAVDGLERQVLRKMKIESEIKELEDYFRNFNKAYNSLNEDEKKVIDVYVSNAYKPTEKLELTLNMSRAQVFRVKAEVFRKFALMVN